jgi:S-adenosylmethionine-diacylglycerol 3-amino-3-carboxypropyl transferase
MRAHASNRFDETLNYSSVNEDWDTELLALRAGPGDRVLCVTGSGARPLALLARTEAEVVAIDRNRGQNHLLRLQLAAIGALSLDEHLRWIGVCEAEPAWRLNLYRRRLESWLEPATQRWCRQHETALARGVVYAGRWERHFRRVSRLARSIWPVDTLFSFEDLERQQEWLAAHWSAGLWTAAWRMVCSPAFSRAFFGDPAFYGRLDVSPGRFLQGRMRRCLETHLARDSFMVSLVLRGTLSPHDMPPHLTESGRSLVRERWNRLRIVDADLVDHLRRGPEQAYDRFSLSDVPSFLDDGGSSALWREILRAAAPGARVVVREFLRRPRVPAGLPISRDADLEQTLARKDRSFGYDFIIASVPDRS